jgi:hypothetical protein
VEQFRVFGTVKVKDQNGVIKWERTGEDITIKVAGDRIIIEHEAGRKIDRYIPSILESVEVDEF